MLVFLTVGFQTSWFRKVREVCRKNFHLVAPLETVMETSYDKQTKQVIEY